MKAEIFDQYVDRVVDIFKISREELFLKDRRRVYSDARYLLYYLCHIRPMKYIDIQRYMSGNGYEVSHAPIINAVKSIKERIKYDKDYIDIVKEIQKSVSI